MYLCTVRRVFKTAAIALFLVASVGYRAAALTQPHHRQNWITPAVAKAASSGGLIFVSDYVGNVVDIFPAVGGTTPIGKIYDFMINPAAITVDNAGDVFVTCDYGLNNIYEFKPPYSGPPAKIYHGNGQVFYGLAVGADGTLYALDLGTPSIYEYAKGKVRDPHILVPPPFQIRALTLDSQGNIVATFTGAGSGVEEIPASAELFKGPFAATNLFTPLYNGIYGFQIDGRGNFAVAYPLMGTIEIYKPGTKTPLRGLSGSQFTLPNTIAFGQSKKIIYISDFATNSIVIADYATGAVTHTISGIQGLGLFQTFAVSPSAP